MSTWAKVGVAGIVAGAAIAIAAWVPDDKSAWWWAGYAATLLLASAVLLTQREPPNSVQAAKTARTIGALALALPLAGIAILTPYALELQNEAPGKCAPISAQPTDEQLKGAKLISDALKITDPAATKITIGNSIQAAQIPIPLDLEPNAAAPPGVARPERIQVHVDRLQRAGDPDVSAAVTAWAKFTTHVDAELWICVVRTNVVPTPSSTSTSTPSVTSPPTGPTGPFTLDPGEYSGSVTILDPRLPTTTIPFTVAVAYKNYWIVAMVWLVVVAAGGVFISIARKEPDGEGYVGFSVVATFLGTWAGLVSLVVGAGAALVAFASTYLNNNVWGAANLEWISLTGAMFTAFVAAATAFRFARVLEDTPLKPATGATAGISGTWTPTGSSPPASVADLKAGNPKEVAADPASVWTSGQYVQTGTAGEPGQAYWDGNKWQQGHAP